MLRIFHPGEFVIDDDTPSHLLITPPGMSTGRITREQGTYGTSAVSTPFPDELLIPEADWQGIIEQKVATHTQYSDIILASGLPSKNQQQTNYCWVNAITGAVEGLRVIQNQPMIKLSAASIGGPLTNYRNVGGYGTQALEYAVDHGIVPQDIWPENAISSRYHTPAAVQAALDYRVVGWYTVQPRNMKQMVSCLLRNIPVPVGLNWWGHEVVFCDAVWLNGAIAIRFRNSWGDTYGSKGFAVLQGSRALADDASCPLTAIAA